MLSHPLNVKDNTVGIVSYWNLCPEDVCLLCLLHIIFRYTQWKQTITSFEAIDQTPNSFDDIYDNIVAAMFFGSMYIANAGE